LKISFFNIVVYYVYWVDQSPWKSAIIIFFSPCLIETEEYISTEPLWNSET
jgi:hypothetical protein